MISWGWGGELEEKGCSQNFNESSHHGPGVSLWNAPLRSCQSQLTMQFLTFRKAVGLREKNHPGARVAQLEPVEDTGFLPLWQAAQGREH